MSKQNSDTKNIRDCLGILDKPEEGQTKSIVSKFSNLRIWTKGDQRAPHKPLLILLALANCQQGKRRLLPFSELEEKLKELLADFGPPRKTIRTVPPFWRLTNDGVWDIPDSNKIQLQASGEPSKQALIKQEICGGFSKDIFEFLKNRPESLLQLAQEILSEHFPETIHEDILLSVGLQPVTSDYATLKLKRDPNFRTKVLTVYNYQCAVCGFDMRLGNNPVCLEAAHIKWHQAGGPAIEQNGMALCTMHHKMFDLGVFTLDKDYHVKVSMHVNGNCGLEEWIYKYVDKQINLPRSTNYYPEPSFTGWHVKEVFKGYKS